MHWNAQVVFRATFVSRRGAIIDLYLATLKRGTPGLNAEFSFVVLISTRVNYKSEAGSHHEKDHAQI